MSEPFIGEIRVVGFAFAPKGWAQCNGQLLPINQNQALFSILGTTYGGNGQQNFALPNLVARVPVHVGPATALGQAGGAGTVSLSQAELPQHGHSLYASTDFANNSLPANALPAAKPRGGRDFFAAPGGALVPLHPGAIAAVGAGQPHENRQPFLTLNFIIALQGIFPPRA
jgi:microcystin-dependent protein